MPQGPAAPGVAALAAELALAGTAVVGLLVLPAPAAAPGPKGVLPVLMLAVATAAGWLAKRVARRSRGGAEAMLAGHALLGIAGFLVLLAWMRSAQEVAAG